MTATDSTLKGEVVDPPRSIYQGLDQTKREIRLMTLSPGPFTTQIECRLSVASLRDENPEYEALSYCWGEESNLEEIMLQNRPFKVRKNLYRALIRLRQQDEPRTLWIDAICINQEDKVERGQQVELMGEVYSQTTNCIIWLGEFFENFVSSPRTIQLKPHGIEVNLNAIELPDDMTELRYTNEFQVEDIVKDDRVVFLGDQSDTAIIKDFTDRYCSFSLSQMIRRFTHSKVRFWPYLGAFCLLRSIADNQHLRDLPCYTHFVGAVVSPIILEALGNILGAPWWRRAWTVQEAILPRTATVILGSISMPFETVLKAGEFFRHHILDCCSDWVKTLSMHDITLIQSQPFLTFGWLSEMKRYYHSPDSSRIRGRTYSVYMEVFRSRWATDPRDKVYGLLGLFSDDWKNTNLLKPDYESKPGVVYARASFRIFQLEGCMDFLFYCDGHSPADFVSAKSFAKGLSSDMALSTRWRAFNAYVKDKTLSCAAELELPSWVPHWTGSDGGGAKAMGFNTSYGFHESPQLLGDTHLSVVSKPFDKIVDISEVFDGNQSRAILSNMRQMVNLEEAQQLLYPNGSSMEDAFLRTLVEDNWLITANPTDRDSFRTIGSAYRRATEADVARVKAILQDILATGLDLERNDVDAEAIRPTQRKISETFGALRRKTFFITETGYFGLGTGDVQVNDEVHIIVGANYPFVLRHVSAQTSGGESAQSHPYQMVGRCYLHGIMYGEAMQGYEQGCDDTCISRITLK